MIRRIFVEKKEGNNVASKKALGDFRSVLNLEVDDDARMSFRRREMGRSG